MARRRITTWSSRLLAAALLAAGSGSASAEQAPDPVALLDAVLAPPTVPYQGHMMITQWYGKTRAGQTRTRAEEMTVHVLPPDRVRREYLSLDGTVERISISDGELESVRLVRSGKTVVGDAVGRYEKVLPPKVERETLLSNYELAT